MHPPKPLVKMECSPFKRALENIVKPEVIRSQTPRLAFLVDLKGIEPLASCLLGKTADRCCTAK